MSAIISPDPAPIFQLATGYWASAMLLAANELGLFGVLAVQPQTASETAQRLATDPRATEMMLNALAAHGLLSLEADKYRLSPAAAAFLVAGQPGYLGSALRWSADQYAAWGSLANTIRTGRPAVDPALHLGGDKAQTRAFVHGMHQRAVGIARGVAALLDLEGCTELLDIGGGPGTYASLLAQRYPDLHATVLDLPPIVAIASELLAAAGVEQQVSVEAADATTGQYGQHRCDAVLFSGVLHQMAPATIQRMFVGAHQALRPGGRVIVSDLMLDRSKTQPAFSTLFSLQMLLSTDQGAVFAAAECAGWLQQTGFERIAVTPLPPPLPYTVVTAHRGR